MKDSDYLEIAEDLRSGTSVHDIQAKRGLSEEAAEAAIEYLRNAGIVQDMVDGKTLIKCPSCGKPQDLGQGTCPACGVIYRKFLKRAARNAAIKSAQDDQDAQAQASVRQMRKQARTPGILGPGAAHSAKGSGVFLGFVAGSMMFVVFGVIGVLLCLTGIGAIIGIPIILAGFLGPFLGPLFGLANKKGKCPRCGSPVMNMSRPAFTCDACRARLLVREGRFVAVEHQTPY